MKKNIAIIIFLVFSLLLLTKVLISTPMNLSSFAKTITPLGIGQLNAPTPTPSPLPGNEIEQLNLHKDLNEEIADDGLQDNVSVYYNNLANNYEVAINADRSWIPASTVKLFVLPEAFRQKENRIINFDSRVVIDQQNVVPTELESQDYQPLRAGSRATIRELVYAMITQSDNTAYNTLLDILDRRNITATLRKLGLANTVVGEKLSLDDNQYAVDLTVPGRQPNTTTAHDFGRLFTLLYNEKIADADEMLTILKQQKINDMLPALLPKGTVIAHKTGTWSPYYHDGGIVYKPNEPYIVAIFTNNDDPNVVARLSKIAYYKTRDVVLGASTMNIIHVVVSLFYSLERWFFTPIFFY